ncbi:MAG: hypothetical protein KGZ82_14995 [Bacteroidales bacterium]|nr:hypothetical protein [Bacteroidales bacterium]
MENQSFTLPKKLINVAIGMVIIGLISLAYGYFGGLGGERIAANLLMNNVYFLGIALIGLFFVAVHAIAESGWQVSVQRIGEAMSAFIPVAGVLMALLFILGGMHALYEWTHADHMDAILLKKAAYLNIPFFSIRFAVYFAGWIVLAHLIRKTSAKLDLNGEIFYFNRLRMLSALFIVFYAVTSVTSSWDWLMSIDAHWFSTLYGWYIFSGMLVSGVAVLIIILFILKRMGLMTHVNDEHVHDLGKYLFGFSIFWAYLWFSQYMLIWYANIPEETVYFYTRINQFGTIFYLNLVLNLIVPLLLLMTRNSKRMFLVLLPVAIVVFIGHWIDLYQIVMPGAVGEGAGIGLLEIGLTIGYAGLFLLVVFRSLSKHPLVPKNHPLYKESLEYHTNY